MHGSRIANGNINPLRFVKLDTTAQGRVVQCTGDTDQVYGVSGESTRYPPYGNLDDGYHAVAGENCKVWILPETEVPLQIGGTVTVGDHLTSDTSGRGVTTSTAQKELGAVALQSGTTDQIINVQLVGPQRL